MPVPIDNGFPQDSGERTPSPRGPLNVYHPDVRSEPVGIPAPEPPDRVFADRNWLALARDMCGTLYVAVEAARHTTPPTPAQEAAQYHLIISTAAIMATELEALAALCAIGLHRPAQIHARAVGLLARNALVFAQDAKLAVSCYDSLEASRKDLFKLGRGELEIVNGLLEVLEGRFEGAAGPSMRELERKHPELFKPGEDYLIRPYFQNAWSKWSHGDIVALADAGDALGQHTNVRDALNVNIDLATSLIAIVTPFALVPYALLCDYGCGSSQAWHEFIKRHETLRKSSKLTEDVDAMLEALGVQRESDLDTGP